MLELTESNFEAETNTGVVVVDFWAEWCAPCRMFIPTLQKLASKYEGKIKFCKVDTTENTRLTALNNVQSLPTLIILKDGQPIQKMVGMQPEKKLSAVLDELI